MKRKADSTVSPRLDRGIQMDCPVKPDNDKIRMYAG